MTGKIQAALTVLLTIAAATPALAQEPIGDTAMGSQIAKHEGVSPERPRTHEDVPLDPRTGASVPGIDVSGHQRNVDWAAQWNAGKRFVYVKATEGTAFKNPYFAQQYNGSYNIGMIRGSYHFALPDRSSGAAQANYFVNNGGGWSKDGKTLPGALDIEYNPYGATCYGLSHAAMVAWIKDFSDTYHKRTRRYPAIYTSTNWWSKCTGNHGDFSKTNPLWVARYNSHIGPLPYAWSIHTIWQYSEKPIDQNSFNGNYSRLQVLARG
ncbi:lysozyme [Allokutzneria albata]|uniref:lysozyme n=1 Tax=Allokutzneria albata TaxID=211114 RepID=A0A1G9Y450_ALLAB|nr:lysozyme [Allokutzneria albata]SDN03235.1 lysozyme [Allokutzneria albata]